jgi:hypothetical protein
MSVQLLYRSVPAPRRMALQTAVGISDIRSRDREVFLPLGMSLRRWARSGKSLRGVKVTPRPGLRSCSCNGAAARILGIRTLRNRERG